VSASFAGLTFLLFLFPDLPGRVVVGRRDARARSAGPH
jgi:hypothetical protein